MVESLMLGCAFSRPLCAAESLHVNVLTLRLSVVNFQGAPAPGAACEATAAVQSHSADHACPDVDAVE